MELESVYDMRFLFELAPNNGKTYLIYVHAKYVGDYKYDAKIYSTDDGGPMNCDVADSFEPTRGMTIHVKARGRDIFIDQDGDKSTFRGVPLRRLDISDYNFSMSDGKVLFEKKE